MKYILMIVLLVVSIGIANAELVCTEKCTEEKTIVNDKNGKPIIDNEIVCKSNIPDDCHEVIK